MHEEIRVTVCKYPDRANLVLRYVDPLTGKQQTKSAGTRDEAKAIGAAAVWQDEIRTGRYAPPSRMTWADFRKRYEAEKLTALSVNNLRTFRGAANNLERLMNPDRLAKLTAAVFSTFQAKLRAEGKREATIGTTLQHLRSALSWGVNQGILPAVPKMEIPRRSGAHGRAVSGEEFDRMLAAVPNVRPADADAWVRYLRGLYLSGLRLRESLALSWDEDAPFAIDLTGRRPAFSIAAAAQKARRDERLPMTEDFYNLIMETPEADRTGPVFKLPALHTGRRIDGGSVSGIVTDIGRKAGVIVATAERRVKRDGQAVTATVKKFASAHDLRRAFGTRWAKRVMPAVLKRLMRHSDIATTMKFYVTMDADAVADELWGRDWEQGNNSGNIGRKKALNPA